jgi:hypothetical protein
VGAAAYQRGSYVIAEQIKRDSPQQPTAFQIMDRINSMPQLGDASTLRKPLIDKLVIEQDAKGWWLMNPEKMYEGFSLRYESLEYAIRSWDIYLTGYDEIANIWTAEVIA